MTLILLIALIMAIVGIVTKYNREDESRVAVPDGVDMVDVTSLEAYWVIIIILAVLLITMLMHLSKGR